MNGNLVDPQSWNAYAYARNNPLRYTDPYGRTYQICAKGGDCSFVSDASWEGAMGNAGAGYLFRNGYMWALVEGKWTYAGTYEQISVDAPPINFAMMVHTTGVLADRWLRESAKDMAIGDLLAVASFGFGLAARTVANAAIAARLPTVVFKVGAANKAALSSAGISESMAKEAVRLLIAAKLGRVPPRGTKIEGFVAVGGRVLKVSAGVNSAGEVNVGAIRVIR